MAGNVWEWCLNKEANPERPEAMHIIHKVGRRVIRDGSWGSTPGTLRASSRSGHGTDNLGNLIGFRLVQDIP